MYFYVKKHSTFKDYIRRIYATQFLGNLYPNLHIYLFYRDSFRVDFGYGIISLHVFFCFSLI